MTRQQPPALLTPSAPLLCRWPPKGSTAGSAAWHTPRPCVSGLCPHLTPESVPPAAAACLSKCWSAAAWPVAVLKVLTAVCGGGDRRAEGLC